MQEANGTKYDYSKLVYIDSETKFEVICPSHGSFWVTPKEHRQGVGCFKCAHEKLGQSKRLSQEEFISRFNNIFKGKYSCEFGQYTNQKGKIKVLCPKHGEFISTGGNLLSGCGCPHCANDSRRELRKNDTEGFIRDAVALLGDKFTYKNVDYIDSKTKVAITCAVHGDFFMQPNNHLQGKGCPKCMKCGYNIGKHGTFYIFQSDNTTKVGITNRKVEIRLNDIRKASKQDFKIHTTFFSEDGSVPYGIEQQVLKYLSSKYKPVEEVFDGSTECFLDVDINDLLSFVAPFSNKTTESQSDLN